LAAPRTALRVSGRDIVREGNVTVFLSRREGVRGVVNW
jgi:hypothetical protein